jgi:hypothetical protein
MPSVNTKGPGIINATYANDNGRPQKSGILCTCKKCKGRYWVNTYQSQKLCEDCRPPAECIHRIKTTEPCAVCKAKYGSNFMRAM